MAQRSNLTIDGTLTVPGTFASTGATNFTTVAAMTMQSATNQLIIQPGGIGFQYLLSAAANPAGNVTLSFYDPSVACNLQFGINKVATLAVGTALTAGASGTSYKIDATNAFTVTLPAAATSIGAWYRFVMMTPTNIVAITGAAGTIIHGTIINNATPSSAAAATNINFTATATLGDMIEVFNVDGTNWSVRGQSTAAAGVSLT